jgi:hypothetical protein
MSGSNALLDQIANPTVMSPNFAQSYGQGQEIAGQINRNRLFQANTARGQLMQQAIDPATGQFDPAQFNKLLAGSPAAAQAAPEAIDQSTRLTTEQLAQATKKLDWVNSVSGAAIQAGDYSDAGVMKIFHTGLASGMMTMPEVQKQLATLPPDAAGRKAWFEQHQTASASTAQQLELRYGKLGTVTGPDGKLRGYTQQMQTGAVNDPKQSGVQTGPSADTVFTAPPEYAPDTRPGALPGSYMPVPRSYPGATTPTDGPQRGDNEPNPLIGGQKSPSSVESPVPVPGMAGQTQGPPNSKPTPPARQVALAAPQGQAAQLDAGNKVYTDAAAAVPDQQKRLIAGETALQALDIARTGPSTGLVAKAKAFFEAQGIAAPVQGDMSAVDYRQVLVKNLLRFAQDGSKSLGTNLGLEDQLHRNANADEMLPNANRHVLVQDLGILRRDLAQTKTMPRGAPAIDHVKDFASNNDPRAFATKYMSSDEITAMVRNMNDNDRAKFVKSLEVAHKAGHVDVK